MQIPSKGTSLPFTFYILLLEQLLERYFVQIKLYEKFLGQFFPLTCLSFLSHNFLLVRSFTQFQEERRDMKFPYRVEVVGEERRFYVLLKSCWIWLRISNFHFLTPFLYLLTRRDEEEMKKNSFNYLAKLRVPKSVVVNIKME